MLHHSWLLDGVGLSWLEQLLEMTQEISAGCIEVRELLGFNISNGGDEVLNGGTKIIIGVGVGIVIVLWGNHFTVWAIRSA